MAHTTREESKLLNCVRSVRGQVEAVERALEQKVECGDVLSLIAACRGAMNALMAEVMEGHIREHVSPTGASALDQAAAAQELIDVVRAYLK
jgi:DNA-binding FrmR family transcriptional regulator